MNKLVNLCVSLGAALLIVLPASLQAQTLPKWELGAGVTAVNLPHYRGARTSESYLVPYPYLNYRSERLKINEDGLQGNLFKSDALKLDISLAGGAPVSNQENGPRAGMHRLAPTFELGPSLDARIWRHSKARSLWWRMPLRSTFSIGRTEAGSGIRHQGWVFSPYLEYERLAFDDWFWRYSLSIGPIFADDNYHGYYYDVSAADALADRPAYSAGGGYSGSRVTFITKRKISKQSWMAAYARLDNLHGAAFEDSPLVEVHDYHLIGIVFNWVFAQSDEEIEVDVP